MTSLRSHLVAWSIRHVLRPGLDGSRPADSVRRHVERFSLLARPPKDIVPEEIRLGGRPALRLTPPQAAKDRAILLLHGGAFVFGSPYTHRSLAGYLARAAGCAVYVPDYRLAPENPAPAALEDSQRALQALREDFALERIVIAGDSAGGGLSLSLGMALRDAGEGQVGGHLLFCPWADLRLQGESIRRNREAEPMLTRDNLALCAEYYAAGADLADPSLSPVNGDFGGLAPLYIQAAGNDILLDDARQIAQRAREAGLPTKIEVFADMYHVFQATPGLVPEAARAVVMAGAWAKTVCG